MSEENELLSILTRSDNLRFAANASAVEHITKCLPDLRRESVGGAVVWYLHERPTAANIRIKRYSTGHVVFYNQDGNRFLLADPDGEPLHECEWKREDGEVKLAYARLQLDCRQWVGIQPERKIFSADIDIKGQPGWESMKIDDLRRQAATAWDVPFSDVKYFYDDKNFVAGGDGKYRIRLRKDGLFALPDGAFETALFISFMSPVRWHDLDLIPVVELFQSTLPGTGGAAFELIWGLHEDQSRERKLAPLRYRGLPTYPSPEAFNIFSAFLTPTGPEGEDILNVFMDVHRSHEIVWEPKPEPPWRYFSKEHGITVAAQNGILYKITVWNDAAAVPYVNSARGGFPSCGRQARVEKDVVQLIDMQPVRDIPLDPRWRIKSPTEAAPPLPSYPFGPEKFFRGNPPETDPVKMLYTVAFYPEGASEIDEAALQPLALDQILYYMEKSPDMPDKLEKIDKVLVHTFDAAIAGCLDCAKKRACTVLYADPEFARKNAQLLWNHAAAMRKLENLADVVFLPEAENVDGAYREQYGMIFKWIPFIYYQDQDSCQAMLQTIVDALQPGGILFLAGPGPIRGLFDHFGLDCRHGDLIMDMPFFRQHLKMCPENLINNQATVFMAEKRVVS